MTQRDTLTTHDGADASVTYGPNRITADVLTPHGFFTVWCVGPDGKEKWRDTITNLVTTVGKNDFLDKYLLGSGYTQTFRMGLKGVGTAVAGDTQASHASWLEVGLANAPTYTGSRKSVTMGSAAAGVSTSPTQAFAITSAGTIAGCFTNNGGSATIDNTTGVLFSAGDFTGGNKVVASLDTVNVVYSLSV
jgi:hypothetical protein